MDLLSITQLLGNLGEFLGAIAVVGTLIYLGIQVRHGKESMDANTRALEENKRLITAETLDRVSERMQEGMRRTSRDKDTASIFLRGNQNLSDLDDAEMHIYTGLVGGLLHGHTMFWRMTEAGFLEREYLGFVDQMVCDFLCAHDGARTYWDETQALYPQRERINQLLKVAGTHQPDATVFGKRVGTQA